MMASLSYFDSIKLFEKSVLGRKISDILKELSSRKGELTEELIGVWEKDLCPQLEKLYVLGLDRVDWKEVYEKISKLDLGNHFQEAFRVFKCFSVSSTFTGFVQSTPSISFERIHSMSLGLAKVNLLVGIMLPPYVPKCGLLYGGYVIYGFGRSKVDYDLKFFEEVERLLPDAAYKAIIPPGPPGSKESEEFFGKSLRCTSSLESFKDAVRRYIVFDRGFRNPYAYSVQVKMRNVLLDLELWLRWKPKRIVIWKHMKQGKSLPPTKVVELLERREELEVVALRIPVWLKEKLKEEAQSRGEQLGTYLREVLEALYSEE